MASISFLLSVFLSVWLAGWLSGCLAACLGLGWPGLAVCLSVCLFWAGLAWLGLGGSWPVPGPGPGLGPGPGTGSGLWAWAVSRHGWLAGQMSVYLSVCLSACPLICLLVRFLVWWSACLCVCRSTHPTSRTNQGGSRWQPQCFVRSMGRRAPRLKPQCFARGVIFEPCGFTNQNNTG